jgi:hypothetical protein
MRSFLSLKPVRLLLATMVSIWMAGGCLLGCSNMAMGTETAHSNNHASQTVEAGESCHAARAHDCCASKKPKKQVAKRSSQPKNVPGLLPAPLGVKDCPLAVNATAATSKNSTHVPDPARTSITALPCFEVATEQSNDFLVVSYLLNRGPTYLRCCVFLI